MIAVSERTVSVSLFTFGFHRAALSGEFYYERFVRVFVFSNSSRVLHYERSEAILNFTASLERKTE